MSLLRGGPKVKYRQGHFSLPLQWGIKLYSERVDQGDLRRRREVRERETIGKGKEGGEDK